MSDSKEKYIGESNLSQTPKKKLTLTLADGAVTTKKIADKAITINKFADGVINDVIRPLIDAAKEEINAQIGAGGVAFSDDFGNSNLIGITQKKLTEAYNDIISRITEDKSAAIVSYDDLDSLFVDKSGDAFTADSPIQYGVTFGQEGVEKISGLLTILVSSDGKVVTQIFDTCLLLDGTIFTNASVYDTEVHRYYRHYGLSDNNIVETGFWTSWKDGIEELAEKLRILQNTPVRYFDGYLEERVVYEAGIAYSGTGGKIYYIAPDNMFVIKPDANNRYYIRWTESGDRLSSEEYNSYNASINKYYIRTDRKFFLVDDVNANSLVVHVRDIIDDNSGHYQGTADSTFSEVNEAFKAGRPIIISEDVILKGQYNVAYISESTLYPNTGYLGLCSTDTGIYILSLQDNLFTMDQDIPFKKDINIAIDGMQMRMESAISGAVDPLNISIDRLKDRLVFLAFNQTTTPTVEQMRIATATLNDIYWYNPAVVSGNANVSIYKARMLDSTVVDEWEDCSYLLTKESLFVDISNKKLYLYENGVLVDINSSDGIDTEALGDIIDEINSRIDSVDSKITSAKSDINSLDTQLTGVRTIIGTHSSKINNLESVNNSQSSSIASLNSSIANIESNCNAYTDQAIEDLRNSSTIDWSDTISALSDRISTIEGFVDLSSTTQDTLQGEITQLGTALREEIASASEEAADAGHKIILLSFVQSEIPALTSPGASALIGAMPHGVYWFNPTQKTLNKGALNGTPPHMIWEEVDLSEETLYVDRGGEKLYIWKNNEMIELSNLPAPAPPSGDDDSDDEEQTGPTRFNIARGNLGAFTIEDDPENITEQDVRNAYTVPFLSQNLTTTQRIWTASEIGLLEGDTNGETNAAQIKAALTDPTCAGIKLDKVYPVTVGNPGANASISRVSDYNSGTTSIIIPRDFIIDGEGTETHEGEAVGGFKILNTKGNLFYTEHSLNLLYVRTETSRGATNNFFNYVVNCVAGVDQVQVIGCNFYDADFVYNSIMLAFEDSDPRGEDWVLPETNCLHHMYMADCEANGYRVLCNSGCMRVTDTFRIVGCEFTNIRGIGIHLATANDLRWENVMAYMSCPIYIAGCTFQGYQGVRRKGGSSPYEAVCIENSALYMLHNEISDFVSVPHRAGDTMTCSECYDAYFNGQQLYYCNNTVDNILSIDIAHSISGIMKAKGYGMDESVILRDFGLEELTGDNIRRGIRYWKNNTYTLDKSQIETWWESHLANNDGNEVEIEYENNLVFDDAATLVLDYMNPDSHAIADYIVEDNTFTSGGNISGHGSDYSPVSKISIKGNTFTAAHIASEEWNYNMNTGNRGGYSYLFAFMMSNNYFEPEIYIEDNIVDVTGDSTENVHMVLFRNVNSPGSDNAKRKPYIWPEEDKVTFKGNQSSGNAATPLLVGFATWYIARNYNLIVSGKLDYYDTLSCFDTTEG